MKKQHLLFIVLIFSACLTSCTYDAEEAWPVDESAIYSFAGDIQPILTKNCVGCHGAAPRVILNEGVAYDNIVPALIDSINPEASIIYAFPSSASHPKEYDPQDAQKVLQWIIQGAENN